MNAEIVENKKLMRGRSLLDAKMLVVGSILERV